LYFVIVFGGFMVRVIQKRPAFGITNDGAI